MAYERSSVNRSACLDRICKFLFYLWLNATIRISCSCALWEANYKLIDEDVLEQKESLILIVIVEKLDLRIFRVWERNFIELITSSDFYEKIGEKNGTRLIPLQRPVHTIEIEYNASSASFYPNVIVNTWPSH